MEDTDVIFYATNHLTIKNSVMKTTQHRPASTGSWLIFLLMALLGSQVGFAQGTLGNYSTGSLSGTPSSVTASGVATNATFSTLTRGSGISGTSASGEFASTGFSTSSTLTISNNEYLQFTITPASCFKFSASSIRLSLYRGSEGPRSLVLRSSLDAYGSNIGSVITPTTSTTTYTISLTGISGLQNSTSAVTLRLYGYFSTTTSGSLRIDDGSVNGVEVDGTVVSVIGNNSVSSAQTICTGSAPASLSGTLPTGGNGSFTYLWQSSTTSATAGFGSAGGSNTSQNYSPGTISQNTWFRRQVTSNGCTDNSPAIQITASAQPAANAGTAVNTCSNSGAVNITAGSSASNQSGVTWTSSGTGSFANANSLTTATYTPSAADISAGAVTLTLTAAAISPCVTPAISTKTLTINTLPTAFAGTAVTTCSTSGAVNITAGSSTTNEASITWTTSNGTGSFANSTSLTNATYTPSAADISAGTRTLVLTAVGKAGCANVTSSKTITITSAPTAAAGTAVTTCSNSGAVNITAGSSSGNNSGITWTSNGTGTFANANSLTTATYTPSAADISAGSVILTLTATPNAPCASNATSTKTLTINTLPSANAGNAVLTCSNSGAVNITAGSSAANQASITWTTSNGTGSFSNSTSLTTATYNPSAADIAAGSRILVLTAIGKTGCSNVTDTKTINITAAPTAVAGTAVSTCANSGAVNITAGSGATNQSGVTWTSSGTGTFANANSLTLATYDPSAADIAAGSVILTLTATGNSPCAVNASTKTLTIKPVPATTGVTICQGTASSAFTVSSTCAEASPVTAPAKFAGSGSTGGSGTAWGTPGNVNANDNNYTSVTGFGTAFSQTLSATNFGFTLPTDASIKGIQVSIGRFRSGGSTGEIQDNSLRLIKGGSVTGNNNGATSVNWPTSETVASYGTTTDLWGSSWNVSDINASNFGVALVVDNTNTFSFLGTRTANIDYIQVSITYAVPGTLNWYTVSSGGTAIGSGSPFNPVGVLNSGLPNTNTAGTTTFYAECASVTGCRTPTQFIINAAPNAPVSGGNQAVCENGNPAQTLTATATGSSVTWYNASTNGSVVASPVLVGVGTVTYYAQSNDGTCNSLTRTPVTLSINAAPAAPAASNQTVCSNGNPGQTLTATATGGTITWYDAATNGNVVANPVQVGVGTSTYYAESSNGTCNSLTRTAVTLTINPVPDAPISGGNQVVCQDNNPAQTLTATATGDNITWYTEASGGSLVGSPTQVGPGTATYYAQASNGLCASLTRTAVTLTINAAPAAPSASNQTVCSDGTPGQTLTATATGGAITWYDAATNGNVIASPVQTGVGTSTYYAESSDGTCNSLTRTAVTLTINPVPDGPISGGNQVVCQDNNPAQTLTATATGDNITWYTEASGGSLVGSPTLVGPGTATYYAQASNGLCASLTRTAVTLTINAAPAAPSASNQTVCSDGTPGQTLTATATGGTITWFDASTNGNVVESPVQTGVGTSTYYAESSDGTCNSLTRTAVTLTINPVPDAPISGGNQVVCQDNNPAQTLTATATGDNVTWYTEASGGSLISSPTQVGPGTATYYAQASNGLCASLTRTAVTLTIIAAPAAPSASNQTVCSDGTPGQTLTATATGGTISWYDAATNGNVVASPTQIGVGTSTYYAQSSDGTCSSLSRTAVTLKINIPPVTPAAILGNKNVCPFVGTGANVTYSIVPVPYAENYRWTLPPYVNLVSASPDSTSITVTFDDDFGASANRQIRVRALSACGNSGQAIIYLTAQFASTPAPITGITNVCAYLNNGTQATYTIPKVTAATAYIWTTPAGVSVTHPNGAGADDTTIVVTFDNSFVSSSITVRSFNDCGTSAARSITIFRNLPPTPGLISGPTNSCEYIAPNGTEAYYTIRKMNGVNSYTWTVPSGSLITHQNAPGVNDTAINVKFPSNFNNGAITVTATNGCGTSTTARSLAVGKLKPATPGIIDVIQLQSCPDRVYSYTIAGLPANALSIVWTVPAAAISFTGQGTTSITVSYPSTTILGNVTATAYNNCGNSVSRISEVKLPVCPPTAPRPVYAGGNNGNPALAKSPVAVSQNDQMEVNIFPNPSTAAFNLKVITAGKEKIKVRILDIQGREFKTIMISAYQQTIIGAELKPGTYLVEVIQGNQRATQQLIKL
jgi:hypothetical protein